VHEILGLARLEPLKTAYTLSLAEPEVMAEQARLNARRPLLKLKIGGVGDLDRVRAVREAAPKCRLIVDANEGLTFDELKHLAPEFDKLGVKLIEQPLKAGADEALEGYECPVPLCADESVHTRADLALCARRYQAINIKLDKAGGLTEALVLKVEARAAGMAIMVGCMVSTSLAIAPSMIVAQGTEFVDLDGPLLLAQDRNPHLTYVGSMVEPSTAAFWG
jgi:L-alanine-DL-glutamate epimerase-like enolase superfamily enzyme